MSSNLSVSHLNFAVTDSYPSIFPIVENRRPKFLEDSVFEEGLDPVEYIKQVRTKKKGKGKR